jgi:hypothetical protein
MKTIEQKAKAYDEALEKARQLCGYPTTKPFISDLQDLFPELKESEDEKIRKSLIHLVHLYGGEFGMIDANTSVEKAIAWLEKQNEQKSTDTCDSSTINGKEFPASEKRDFRYFIKPKFHEGDWVVDNKSGITQQVLDFRGGIYTCTYNSFTIDCESNYHLWTIKDAKNGDVLQLGTVTAIFKKYIGQEKCICYCSIDEDGVFEIPIEDGEDNIYGCTNTTPATKEQRALLFAKMEEAGYEFDFEKKEVKKIHVIDEGKAEMDYCFTKMMNGEKVSPAWSEKDKERFKRIASFMWQNRKGDTDEIFQQEQDVKWLNSLICENS